MSADAAEKFPGLPGVVTDQPDTFETDDVEFVEGPVPSTSKSPSKPVPESENIDNTSLDTSSAAAHFRGKSLRTDSANFSDSITARAGYMSLSEYTIAEEKDKETPQQKLLRLQAEVKEFQEELATIQEASVADASDDSLSPVELAAQVKAMLGDLQQVNLENMLGTTGPDGLPPSVQSDVTKRLIGEINKVNSAAAAATTGGKDAPAKAGDTVTYELFYQPEHAKFAQVSKAGALEARLKKLEDALGAESLAPLAVELDMPTVTVQGAAAKLSQRVAALSELNLSDLDRRLGTVLSNLEVTKTKQPESADKSRYNEQVNELYETGKRWDGTAAAMPALIDRLVALKTLHEQGAEFSQTLTHLETIQQQLKDQLTAQSKVLGTVDETMKKNMAIVQSNVKSITERIDALHLAIAALK